MNENGDLPLQCMSPNRYETLRARTTIKLSKINLQNVCNPNSEAITQTLKVKI